MSSSAGNSAAFLTLPNSEMLVMPLALFSARTASITPTLKMAAANSCGAVVTLRPTKIPPALVPMMPSVAGEA